MSEFRGAVERFWPTIGWVIIAFGFLAHKPVTLATGSLIGLIGYALRIDRKARALRG
jgi:hypothetical protein